MTSLIKKCIVWWISPIWRPLLYQRLDRDGIFQPSRYGQYLAASSRVSSLFVTVNVYRRWTHQYDVPYILDYQRLDRDGTFQPSRSITAVPAIRQLVATCNKIISTFLIWISIWPDETDRPRQSWAKAEHHVHVQRCFVDSKYCKGVRV